MTPEQFKYWVKGLLQTNKSGVPTKAEWKLIEEEIENLISQTPISSPVFPYTPPNEQPFRTFPGIVPEPNYPNRPGDIIYTTSTEKE